VQASLRILVDRIEDPETERLTEEEGRRDCKKDNTVSFNFEMEGKDDSKSSTGCACKAKCLRGCPCAKSGCTSLCMCDQTKCENGNGGCSCKAKCLRGCTCAKGGCSSKCGCNPSKCENSSKSPSTLPTPPEILLSKKKDEKRNLSKCKVCEGRRDVYILDSGRNRGKLVRECEEDKNHDTDVYDFEGDALKVNEMESILRHAHIPKDGDRSKLLRMVLKLHSQIDSDARPRKLNQTTRIKVEGGEESSIGSLFRKPVSTKRDDCNVMDVYVCKRWSEHEDVQVDHIIECQIFGYAYETMEGVGTREQTSYITDVVNDINNLNVTSTLINGAKGGRGGAFNVAVKHLIEGGVGDESDGRIRSYFNVISRRIPPAVQDNICKAIVNSWDSHVSCKLQENGKLSRYHDSLQGVLEKLGILEK
jgi:hypothetical protein